MHQAEGIRVKSEDYTSLVKSHRTEDSKLCHYRIETSYRLVISLIFVLLKSHLMSTNEQLFGSFFSTEMVKLIFLLHKNNIESTIQGYEQETELDFVTFFYSLKLRSTFCQNLQFFHHFQEWKSYY